MKRIPLILLFSRIPAGLMVILLTVIRSQVNYAGIAISWLMAYAVISDIFDGILARKLGVSHPKMRVWDSSVDQFFWVSTIACSILFAKAFYENHLWAILTVVTLEVIAYIISYIKFRKPVATHSILAKIWTISLCVFLIVLFLNGSAGISYWIMIVIGAISRLEIIGILVVMKEWQSDIPNIIQALRAEKGEEIIRNKWFNG